MRKLILVALCMVLPLLAKDTLVFGAITTQKVTKVKKKLTPFLKYLEQETGKKVVFKTGKTYGDTISKFNSGEFDFGYIGPSPYVIASKEAKNLNILAGLETKGKPYFYGVIVAAKNNANVNAVADLAGKDFGFGSKKSTLSFYMPAHMLMEAGVADKLSSHSFLGKHDKVALAVIKGKVAAGGIKEAVANKYANKLKVVAKSEPVYDFMIVAHKGMDSGLQDKIKAALLKLKDKKVLKSIKKGATGFIETSDSNYDSLKKVMSEVDTNFKK
jgi:phosphonate transport system substrate-binding protein